MSNLLILVRRSLGAAALTVLLAGGFTGCAPQPADTPQRQPLTVFVPDLSGSSTHLRPAMDVEMLAVLTAAAAGDGRVVVVGVSGDSDGDRFGAVSVDFRAERPAGLPHNELTDANFRTDLIKRGMDRYHTWVARHRDPRGSDYAGGLRRAADVLTGAGGAGELVLVGDGFSNGGLVTGRRGDTPAICQRTARQTVQSGQLPLLTNVPVHWVGVATPTSRWTRLFKPTSGVAGRRSCTLRGR